MHSKACVLHRKKLRKRMSGFSQTSSELASFSGLFILLLGSVGSSAHQTQKVSFSKLKTIEIRAVKEKIRDSWLESVF